MSGLKPCLFCPDGGKPRAYRSCGSIRPHWVECDECGAKSGHRETAEEAEEAWNTRHELTCHPVTEVMDSVDIGIGYLDRLRDNCSVCGEPLTADYSINTPERRVLPNYCPNCGARMVEE